MSIVRVPLPILRRDLPMAKHLVAAWQFYEQAGDTLHDVSGHGNHIATDSAVWSDRSLIIANGGASVGTSDISIDLQPMTLFYYLKFNAFTTNAGMGGIGSGFADGTWSLRVGSGSKRTIKFNKDGSGGDVVATTADFAIQAGVWGLLALTWDGTMGDGARIHWQGEDITSASAAGGTPRGSSAPFVFMRSPTAECNIATGCLLDIVVTPAEMLRFANDPDYLFRPRSTRLPVVGGAPPATGPFPWFSRRSMTGNMAEMSGGMGG